MTYFVILEVTIYSMAGVEPKSRVKSVAEAKTE